MRERLSTLKQQLITRVTIAPFVRAFELLPKSQAARILERVHVEGRLDYRPCDIRMELQSGYQVSRLRSCKKEPETVRWLERELRRGDVLCDIGANVGAYSLVAHAATRGECRIYAFEPSFSTFAALCRNVQLNNCGNAIVPLPIALSDQTAITSFNYFSVTVGAALHTAGEAIDYKGEQFRPELILPTLSYRLDDLAEHLRLAAPTHLKIDVDGIELSVLRGAERALSSVRSVLLEVEQGSTRHGDIAQYLHSMGFVSRGIYPAITEGFANAEFARI
jgi:FkbM family methyltransferase